MTIDIPEGYEALGLALGEAVSQASRGKGAERHAESGERFSDQLIMSIPRRLGEGGECFCLGQALKKICESRRLPQGRARAEILGAINYLAAAWSLSGGAESVFAPEDADALRAKKERVRRIIAANPAVCRPEAPKDAGNVCLGFAERVVSLMKEAGIREVSFAAPGARICADGTVTGLHFTRESVSAPEDADMPRFREGQLVEYRLPAAAWTPANVVCMDGGYVVLDCGGPRFRVPSFDVRPVGKI